MLAYDPKKRPTASECLQHPYFQVRVPIPLAMSMDELESKQPRSEGKDTAPQQISIRHEKEAKREEPEKKQNKIIKMSTMQLLKTCRYKPGVNSKNV